MSHDVSSYFVQESSKKQGSPIRRFTIAGSDYSRLVTKWPAFRTAWDSLRPIKATLNCANGNQDFNFLRTIKTNIRNRALLEMGFGKGTSLKISSSTTAKLRYSAPNSFSAVQMSIEFMTYVQSLGTSRYYTATAAGGPGEAVLFGSGGKVAAYYRGGAGGVTIYSPDTYDGELIHVGGAFRPADGFVNLFVNGALVNCAAVSSYAIDNTPFDVGYDSYNGAGGWPSSSHMYGLRVYNRVLSDLEMYEHSGGLFKDDSGLCLRAPFTKDLADISSADNGEFTVTGSGRIESILDIQEPFTLGDAEPELLAVLDGTVERVSYEKGAAKVTVSDKFSQLQERIIGTSDVPVSFVGSNYLLSDVAWWVCTSYGGLSAVQSSSNEDIDYASFSTWAGVFSGDSVYLNAKFTGTKAAEALRKIARISQSAIYQEDNKLYFNRFSFADSNQTQLNNSTIKNMSVEMDDKDIVNRQYVMADYDITSRYHKITVVDQSSASVNSYGLREAVDKDSSMWYVDSVSAINMAQRSTSVKDEPYDKASVSTTLVGVLRQVGEMVILTDDNIGVSAEPYRIMERSLNMDTGEVTFRGDASQLLDAFRLDYSALDSSDVLS